MKRWQIKLLGELSETIMGQAPPGNESNFDGKGTPFVKAGEFGKSRPIIREWTTKPLRYAKSSDVLVCVVGATCGKLNLGADCAIGRSVAAIRPNPSLLNQGFLYAFLQGWTLKLRSGSQGSAQGVITRDMLASIPIPLPPLAEQERIVKLLEEADELRKLRTQADSRTANLVPALFHEMFGDPITNPKGWPSKRLGELTFINPRLSKDRQPAPETEISFVPMAAVDEVLGVISSGQVKQFREVSKGYTPFRDGDVLFAKITPCMENGKSAIAKKLVGGMGFGSTEFHVLRPTDVITSEYVFWLVRRPAFRSLAEQHFTGTAGQQRVPTSFLENHPCPVPPPSLQKEFAQRVTEIRELEAIQAASRQRLESLFQSMLHRAFNGEI